MLKLKTEKNMNTFTAIPDWFLDRYLPKADGEFVKIYLLLWRQLCAGKTITTADLAVMTEDSEKNILRAIRYWEKQRLLSCLQNDQGEIVEISFLLPEETVVPVASPSPAKQIPTVETRELSGKSAEEKRKISPDQHRKLANDEEFGTLVYIVGKYLSKSLQLKDCQVLEYLYGELGMSAELLEYIVETCVDTGRASLHYIEKVALDWHEKGIVTVDQAKEISEVYKKQYYQILKAFGVTMRGPAPEEKAFMDRWLYELRFAMEVILEACRRTIRATHTPNFNYANKILLDWREKGVKGTDDIRVLDEEYQKKKDASTKQDTAQRNRNRFHNFEQSGVDYDKLLAEYG